MIIDIHAHVDKKFVWDHRADTVLQMMDRNDIRLACVTTLDDIPGSDPNTFDRFVETIRSHSDKFVGFIRLNPWSDQAIAKLEQARAMCSIKGVKFHTESCVIWPYHDLTIKIVNKAAEFGLPILFHSGDSLSMPVQIARAAEICPRAKIVMAHMGGFLYGEEAIEVASRLDNVYVDIAGAPFSHLIKKAVKALGPEKILFGSDMPGVPPEITLATLKEAQIDNVSLNRILFENAVELLGVKV